MKIVVTGGARPFSLEFHDRLIDSEAVSRSCVKGCDDTIPLGDEDVFHLHRLHHRQFFSSLDLLSRNDIY